MDPPLSNQPYSAAGDASTFRPMVISVATGFLLLKAITPHETAIVRMP